MTPIKIEAIVRFNDQEAYALSRMPEFKYQRDGNILWANDSGFFSTYEKGCPGAFAGREFDIPMADGSVIRSHREWWDSGASRIADKMGIPLIQVPISTEKKLKKCYVFSGGISVEKTAFEKMRSEYAGYVYPYWDYEKIIKFDDMRRASYRREEKLDRKCKAILQEARRWKLVAMGVQK